MNDFIFRKLGEVLAFERSTEELFSLTKNTLSRLPEIGAAQMEGFVNLAHQRGQAIESLGYIMGGKDAVLVKAEKTGEKIKKMRDIYLGQDFEDAPDVLEFLGFFEGGAIIHWELVSGFASANDFDRIVALSQEAIRQHAKQNDLFRTALRNIAATQSK